MRMYLIVFSSYFVIVNAINVLVSAQHNVPLVLSLLVTVGSITNALLLAEGICKHRRGRVTARRRSRRVNRCRRQYHLAKIPGRN